MQSYRNINARNFLAPLAAGLVALTMVACDSDTPNYEVLINPTSAPATTSVYRSATPYPVTATPRLILAPAPTATQAPTLTPSPIPTPQATAQSAIAPTPEPTKEPYIGNQIEENVGYITEDGVVVRSEPTSSSQLVRTLGKLEKITILERVEGESWISSGNEDLYSMWDRVEDGYIYSPFVFVPRDGEALPFVSGNKWVEIYREDQVLHAYADGNLLYQALVSVGRAWTPTPLGDFSIQSRIFDEFMTDGATYWVPQILYTQYFTNQGHALHLNYWSPLDAFGNYPTSHGCVGLTLHDAQWLWLFGFSEMPVKVHK